MMLTPVFMISLYAQPIPPAPSTPIGGGLGLLISSIVVYGLIKKIRSKK